MTDFSVNSNDIIEGAIRALGALSTGESLPANEMVDGREALNMIVKQLMGPPHYLMKGVKPWQREEASLTLAAKIKFEFKTSGGDLDITPPVDIISARLVDSDDNETPLKRMSREKYDSIGNKTDTNTPTAFYYERRLDSGYFYLDCIPSDITNYTIDITYLDQMAAFTTVRTTTDFPQEWYRVLKFSLAVDLGPEYGADISNVTALRNEAIAIANNFHQDRVDAYFQPGIDE
jgi:hypothetical protein